MISLNVLALFTNGLTLALALGFLLLILWHDTQSQQNQFFAMFLVFVTLWNVGSLLVQVASLSDMSVSLLDLSIGIMELGFAGSTVSIYILLTVLIGAQTRRFRVLALASLSVIVLLRIFLIVRSGNTVNSTDEALSRNFQPIAIIFYVVFNSATLYLTWRFRRKLRSGTLVSGILVFALSQSLIFINPELIIASFTSIGSSVGALMVSFAILQNQIMTPLAERNHQVEAMHRVSLAVTSQLSLETVLNEIAVQAAGWLNADATCIFLTRDRQLEVVAVYQMPLILLHTHIDLGQGVAGKVAERRESLLLENYDRDWSGEEEFSISRATFGSVICVPLSYAQEIIGVLLVVSGKQGRLFDRQDVRLLELFGAQAAVAISHSQLFKEQHELTRQLEAAHGQLQAVVTSTENPVIAVNREFQLIFCNPAAEKLFKIHRNTTKPITELIPLSLLPGNYAEVLRHARRAGGYVYEVSIEDRVYLCHVGILGKPRIAGWVGVLNDITKLKELDRMKSEMVRMASHDLKNPLMGAMAYLELLNDDLSDKQNAEALESVQLIERQLERMQRIIQGVLDAERFSSSLEMEELCEPQAIIIQCLDELDYQIREADISIELIIEDGLPRFKGDCAQFQRAIVNLIENAVKFTLKDGYIHIRVFTREQEIVFEIEDNGIGIPANLQDKVFERFFRGQQIGVEHVSGSGLGLSLVKSIVSGHGGRIQLKSEEGVGTTFQVSVPIAYDNVSHSQEPQ